MQRSNFDSARPSQVRILLALAGIFNRLDHSNSIIPASYTKSDYRFGNIRKCGEANRLQVLSIYFVSTVQHKKGFLTRRRVSFHSIFQFMRIHVQLLSHRHVQCRTFVDNVGVRADEASSFLRDKGHCGAYLVEIIMSRFTNNDEIWIDVVCDVACRHNQSKKPKWDTRNGKIHPSERNFFVFGNLMRKLSHGPNLCTLLPANYI